MEERRCGHVWRTTPSLNSPESPNLDIFEAITSVVRQEALPSPNSPISYKSAQNKLAYEAEIKTRVRPYLVRYFAQIDHEIQNRVDNEPLSLFHLHLEEAWEKHNRVNETIDRFLFLEDQTSFKDWSLNEWIIARSLLEAAFDVDHQKNVYSGGIKRKLGVEIGTAVKRYGLSPNEERLLLTPGFPTFHERYFYDHLSYFMQTDFGIKQGVSEEYLLSEYHCGDPELLAARVNAMRLDRYTRDETVRLLEEHRERLEKIRIKKGYLMLERPDLKLIEELLRFDNLTEYVWSYSFKGFPDLFLREEIARRLKLSGILQERVDPLALTRDEFLGLVDQQIDRRGEHFTIRLRPYRQTENTCGSCCVMMILDRVGVPLNHAVEHKIWERVGQPYNFPGGMAKVLLGHGFRVTYYQYPDRFFTPTHPDIRSGDPYLRGKARQYMRLHKEAIEGGMGLKVEDWDSSVVFKNLRMGNVCIVGVRLGVWPDEGLHWIIVRGYRGNQLEVIDPLGVITYINRNKLEDIIQTTMGKRMLVVEKFPQGFLKEFSGSLEAALT